MRDILEIESVAPGQIRWMASKVFVSNLTGDGTRDSVIRLCPKVFVQ